MCNLTVMLLVVNLAKTKWHKNPEKLLKPWQMDTHLRVLSESYPMNTNIMTGFRWFSKIFDFLCFRRSYSLSFGRVPVHACGTQNHPTIMVIFKQFPENIIISRGNELQKPSHGSPSNTVHLRLI